MAVKIVKADKYAVKRLTPLMRDALEELGVDLQTKRTALLKPNIVIPVKPASAIITHPAVVEAVVAVLEENGFEDIVVGEGAGLGADESEIFEVAGYTKLERRGVRLVNLNKAERVEINWKYGRLRVPKIVAEADLYVNLPKMKTHGQTVVTLSLKNQKGILSHADKMRFHKWGLHEPLVELAKVVKPDLIVVDALEAMEGEGPLRGKKKKVGALVIGTNLLETDIACCELMGINPNEVEHLTIGMREDIGAANPHLIAGSDALKTSFKRANAAYGNILKVYSWRNPYACSMCIDSFTLAVKSALRDPKYWLTFLPKFAYLALFKRIDIIQGFHAHIPDKHGRIICLGDCTKELAKKNNSRYVKGCPPTSEEIIAALMRS
ncbi:MAG: DUF362 domain-containing protein [Methanophagales archaeon ANME-1-THS]|nr:MAG: DUF362 domain-containing protein [Methanophagales archaeon ANME-1-THS]